MRQKGGSIYSLDIINNGPTYKNGLSDPTPMIAPVPFQMN
jgi:hypothetical protein